MPRIVNLCAFLRVQGWAGLDQDQELATLLCEICSVQLGKCRFSRSEPLHLLAEGGVHMLCHRNGQKNKGTLRDTKPLSQGTRCQRSLPCKSTCVGVTVPLTFARPVSFRSGLSSWHRRSCDLKQRSPSSGCSRSRGMHLRPARGTLGPWMHGRSGSRGRSSHGGRKSWRRRGSLGCLLLRL